MRADRAESNPGTGEPTTGWGKLRFEYKLSFDAKKQKDRLMTQSDYMQQVEGIWRLFWFSDSPKYWFPELQTNKNN